MSVKSMYYNHPFWPSPRAVRIARLLFERNWYSTSASGRPKKPEGRLTHDKALSVMADYLDLSVHEFLHIQPIDALKRLKLAVSGSMALKILGDNTKYAWCIIGGSHFLPCCVRAPAPAATAPAATAPAATAPAATAPAATAPAATAPAATAPAATAPAATAPAPTSVGPVLDQMRESILEYFKEENGAVTAYDRIAITDILQRFRGRTV